MSCTCSAEHPGRSWVFGSTAFLPRPVPRLAVVDRARGARFPSLLRSPGPGGPTPAGIALVPAGRCRPSPGPVTEGTPSARHRCGVVPCRGAPLGGMRLLPVLRAPRRGTGGVDSDHADTGCRARRQEACAESAGGDTGDELPELLLPAVFLAGLGVGGVEVPDRSGPHARGLGPVPEAGEGVAEPCVTVFGRTAEVVVEATRCADRVAVSVHRPRGQVVGVGVHADHATGPQGVQRDHGQALAGPGRVEVPAAAGWSTWMR